jgi:DNA-binding IclR family transcriptional regulator
VTDRNEFQETAEAAPRRQKVQSVEMGMTVLKVLGSLGGSASLTVLAARLDEHPSKVHRYLMSLVSSGFVYQDQVSSRYVLGTEAVIIGLAAQRQSDVLTLAAAELARLTETLDVTSFVAVLGNVGPVIVRWEEPVQSVVVNVRVGSVMPILWSATGRVFAAFHLTPEVDAAIAHELASTTPQQRKQLPSRAAVNRLLQEYRAQGCAWVNDTLLTGISGVAAPIFDSRGHVTAVIATLGISGVFDPTPQGRNARELRRSAAAVSSRLGYSAAAD